MIILLSPSKTLDYDTPVPAIKSTRPDFLDQSEILIGTLRKKSPAQIKQLMGISDKLAALNHRRFQDFATPFTPANARPCIFAFRGDVYDGLQIETFDQKALERAQQHLRILSGLYGLLRPFDLMQPYRLEMGTKLPNPRGKNLYEFWGDRITEKINETLAGQKQKLVVNLASNEYFSAINTQKLEGTLITPTFKEQKGNDFKVIGLFAKKARGMMARHLLQHNITNVADMKQFSSAGYGFAASLSTPQEPVFTRRQAKAA